MINGLIIGMFAVLIRMKRKLSAWSLGEILMGAFFSTLNYKLQGKGAALGAFVFLGAIPLGVDFYSGAVFQHDPSRIDVKLKRTESKRLD